LQCCESSSEERSAGNPHATICGNRRWATASGDPVAGLQCLAPLAYLRAYDTVSEARTSIGRYFKFYNTGRPHSSLDRQTPDQAYFNRSPHAAAA
jgi:transposase InsO family protein